MNNFTYNYYLDTRMGVANSSYNFYYQENISQYQSPESSPEHRALLAVACQVAAVHPLSSDEVIDLAALEMARPVWENLYQRNLTTQYTEKIKAALLRHNAELTDKVCDQRHLCFPFDTRHVKFPGTPGRMCESLEAFFEDFSLKEIFKIFQATDLSVQPKLPVRQLDNSYTNFFEWSALKKIVPPRQEVAVKKMSFRDAVLSKPITPPTSLPPPTKCDPPKSKRQRQRRSRGGAKRRTQQESRPQWHHHGTNFAMSKANERKR